MKALILNSGLGHRMGDITKTHPKCMTQIDNIDTIISRQLKMLEHQGIMDVIITTGYYEDVLVEYCKSLGLNINLKFVRNPLYDKTNYIYSVYCARDLLDDDVFFMHGDLVFDESVLEDMIKQESSCMKVSSTKSLPEKDFKAVVVDGRVKAVGVEFFSNAMEAQAFYKLNRKEMQQWLDKIIEFCENGNTNVYAEKALNEITDVCSILAYDVRDRLCAEIDTPEDLDMIKGELD